MAIKKAFDMFESGQGHSGVLACYTLSSWRCYHVHMVFSLVRLATYMHTSATICSVSTGLFVQNVLISIITFYGRHFCSYGINNFVICIKTSVVSLSLVFVQPSVVYSIQESQN